MAIAEVATESSTAPYLADFERFAAGRNDAPGLAALRRKAVSRFAELGFPTSRQEEWRFMPLAPITRGTFARPRREELVLPEADELKPFLFESSARLVFVDGFFAAELSTFADIPSGIVLADLASELSVRGAQIEQHLGRHASFERHPFVALNTAFFADGAYLHIPDKVVLEKPVHLLYLTTGRPVDGHPALLFPRTLIVAGANSQLTVVETYQALGEGAAFSCGVSEVVAGPGSVIDHCKVQREGMESIHVATFQLHQERSSAFSSHSISLGGSLVRNDVNALLNGEGADAILNGLYMIGGRQFVDFHMRVEHATPHCTSHELFKGILDGKARSVFNGLIHVWKDAQKTDAKQSNRNLLLSKEAVANSNPQLEIFADDVKCTHGSTVGQLDEDAVFYLRSRGIGEEAARSLLTYAFASDIAERIKVESVRHDLEEFLFTALPKGDVVRQAV